METRISKFNIEIAYYQRLESLKNAFATIRLFATPTCSPEMFNKLEDIEKYLIENYSQPIENYLIIDNGNQNTGK